MIIKTRATKLAALAAVVVLPLSITACGSSTAQAPAAQPSASAASSSAPMESPSMSPSESASASASSADAPFGPGCASVPASGKGSFDGMSSDPVATAASNNPLLSTLVTAVGKAGLGDTLNTTDNITVFAPTNDAFKAMDQATLTKALGDKKLLTSVLTLHVVPGRLSPDQLAGTHKTLNGQSITIKGSGEDFTVGPKAKVVCGNVQTSNATVYLIDQVLLPTS
ncbi:MAG: fasciclin domain-containing protein [Propionibacteriaceae bacterium]